MSPLAAGRDVGFEGALRGVARPCVGGACDSTRTDGSAGEADLISTGADLPMAALLWLKVM